MTDRCRAAAVQMTCGPDKEANLATATRLVEQAAGEGAQLVVLPELFQSRAPAERMAYLAEPIPGPTSRVMSELAARLKLTLVAGSIAERESSVDGDSVNVGKPGIFNSSLLFDSAGVERARYRKQHLFNVDLPGRVSIRESDWSGAGSYECVTSMECGRIGQAICYDLRFPELFRRMATASVEIIALPSAFAVPTGRDHWEILVRARAIENQAFVIAANQTGRATPSFDTYGHSLIVDPWGTVLATMTDGEGVIVADLDFETLRTIRAQLPALAHRRR